MMLWTAVTKDQDDTIHIHMYNSNPYDLCTTVDGNELLTMVETCSTIHAEYHCWPRFTGKDILLKHGANRGHPDAVGWGWYELYCATMYAYATNHKSHVTIAYLDVTIANI